MHATLVTLNKAILACRQEVVPKLFAFYHSRLFPSGQLEWLHVFTLSGTIATVDWDMHANRVGIHIYSSRLLEGERNRRLRRNSLPIAIATNSKTPIGNTIAKTDLRSVDEPG